jgi:DNA modification methylase
MKNQTQNRLDAAGAYLEFLKSKVPAAEAAGFEPPSPPHESLFGHQVDIALWACRGGRRAVFASFGLGKTRIHLQIAKWVVEHSHERFLIICPLGVKQEFTQSDGPAMGVHCEFIRTTAQVLASDAKVFITNYESVRDGKIDLSIFGGAGLDESSVLRSFGSKTYQTFLGLFKSVRYRYVFTATPSPNRYKELIHYAGFLGVMDTGDALTRFFKRDSEEAGNLQLMPSMERQFWHWLGSWAAFIQKPSDLGYSDEGYDLPKIHVHWHRLEVDHKKAWAKADNHGQFQLLEDQTQGLADSAATKRDSIKMRVAKACEIIDSEPLGKHWLVWHDLEPERLAIEKAMPLAKTVYGKQDLDEREGLIMGFSRGEYSILATKPIIAGSGCNFQKHCADAVFLGVGYKFNDFIQAIHRIHRFQQKCEVHIHIVHLDSEDAIVAQLQAKWKRHESLVSRMTKLLKTFKLQETDTMEMIRSLGCERTEIKSSMFRIIHNDCVQELLEWPDNQVDMICTSIPFGNQYEYSPSFNDFGHNEDNEAFFRQMEFLCPELLRTLKPGRIAAIHVKDRIRFGNMTGDGFPTVDPFSDMTVEAFRKAGFRFMARITIDTDVVRENNQTYRLAYKEVVKDGTKMGAGMPEYVLIFRKLPSDTSNGYADDPVTKVRAEYSVADWQVDAAGLWRSNGNRLLDPEIIKHMPLGEIKRIWETYAKSTTYSYEEHVALAQSLKDMGRLPGTFMLFPPVTRHPDVWTDIQRINTLNSRQSQRQQEGHVCPLQLDIIQRLIGRYSNKGEVVYDPFAGIGSTPYQALKMGRHGWGTELNADYWKCAVDYCERAENEAMVPTLFEMASTEGAA